MKLIYLTSQKYPSKKVEPFFLKSMAGAFSNVLNEDFLFVIRGETTSDLKNINTFSINGPVRYRILFYFFKLLIVINKEKWNNPNMVFFSSDPYLLSIIIFWRKIFHFKYKVCSDWHQLFEDWRDTYIAKNSDYMISTSKRLRDLLVSVAGGNFDKIEVCYGGVDTGTFFQEKNVDQKVLRTRLKLPDNFTLVGYVGGFKAIGMEKGIATMIRAISYLPNNIKMVFIGGRDHEISEYQDLVQKEEIKNIPIFVKRQSFDKVVEYEKAMDILAIPYPNKKHFVDYGFPMKVWEYMASGRLIVYSNLEIIGEVLDKRGVSFVPDNPKSFADAVIEVLRERNLYEKLSRENMDRVLDFTWEKRARRIVDFIKK